MLKWRHLSICLLPTNRWRGSCNAFLINAIPVSVLQTGQQWREHGCVRLLFNILLGSGPGNAEFKNLVYS